MKLTGIHHVSILVSDMERAVAWSENALGRNAIWRCTDDVKAAREVLTGRGEVREPTPIAGTVEPAAGSGEGNRRRSRMEPRSHV